MKFKKILIIVALVCSATVFAEAQETDKQLWGTWQLDSVQLTINFVSQKYALPALYLDKSKLPRNLFTSLYFDGDDIGVSTTETEFLPAEQVCFKGSFATNSGKILITMRDEQKREFSYSLEKDVLRIGYFEGTIQFALVYKLIAKL